jgi:hypothetical protein
MLRDFFLSIRFVYYDVTEEIVTLEKLKHLT